ncbi:hypothetical protein G6F43_008319 [Rhizopus delemar]|nr:hypothetical protein G6F43_008319 [Rhizopus delemar]
MEHTKKVSFLAHFNQTLVAFLLAKGEPSSVCRPFDSPVVWNEAQDRVEGRGVIHPPTVLIRFLADVVRVADEKSLVSFESLDSTTIVSGDDVSVVLFVQGQSAGWPVDGCNRVQGDII